MSFIPSAEQKRLDKKKAKETPNTSAVPVTQDPDYCADLDGRRMNFDYLKDKKFIVAVNTGSRNKAKLLASTIRGPFEFYEMIEAVGCMYQREQHHAKVYTLEKSFDKPVMFLDEGTIDYIEANWEDIVTTGILESSIFDDDIEEISAGLVGSNYGEELE
jgi:hypothetical protein